MRPIREGFGQCLPGLREKAPFEVDREVAVGAGVADGHSYMAGTIFMITPVLPVGP